MQIFWSARALRDLEKIAAFLSEKSEPAAVKMISGLIAKPHLLQQNPQMGKVQQFRTKQARQYRFLVESHYKLYYTVRESKIFIETVFDTRQDPEKLTLK